MRRHHGRFAATGAGFGGAASKCLPAAQQGSGVIGYLLAHRLLQAEAQRQ